MRSKTTAALAATGAMVAPAVAVAAPDPPSPLDVAVRAPLAGHLTVASQMRAERRENLQEDLIARAARIADEPTAERRRLRDQSPDELRERIGELRRVRERERERAEAQAVPAASPTLEAIAACESGGEPTTDTGNGFYGKYQFTLSTWQSVGGTGNPAAAPEAEQDARAAMLYEREGSAPWPVCGG